MRKLERKAENEERETRKRGEGKEFFIPNQFQEMK